MGSWQIKTQRVLIWLATFFLLVLACTLAPCEGQLNNYEVLVLMRVKECLIDPQNETSGWDSGYTDPCIWHHVTCSSQLSVVRLELGRLQLSGTISPDIAKLTNLQILSLEDNNITGYIPAELGVLSNLQILDLSSNQLNGQIPASLGQLKNINSLLLDNNSLSGPIPPSLASIGTLSSVDFSYNNLSGQVPHLSAVFLRAEGNEYLCGDGTGHDCPGQGQSLPLNDFHGVESKLSHATKIVLIVCALIAVFLVTGICIWWCRRPHRLYSASDEQQGLDTDLCLGQLQRYSLRELQQATNDFNSSNLLGTGGSGQVYKGCLQNGSIVAVKRLKDHRAVAEFKVELEMISLAAHRNLLRLLGCCTTSTEFALVFPYMSNGSVASRLREKPALDWNTRKHIALGSARGLVYLHEQCDPKIIHGDVKAANILLDEEGEAVVADFGLAKFLDHSVSHVTTAVRGTFGYIPPESLSGQISAKTDVYSYGILLLELIVGQTEIGFRRLSGQKLLDWARKVYQEKKLDELVDGEVRRMGYEVEELEMMVQVALLCTLSPYVERPKMSEVLQMLEGEGLADRWETWQKAEANRCNAVEQQQTLPSSYLDLLCDTSHVIELQLSGPR